LAAPRGAYHWDPNEDITEIWISDENTLDAEKIGMRPAISFTRGPVQFFTLGLDDMAGYKFDTGQKTKSVLVPGTMSINCCSRNDLESEQLAWIVAEQLWMNRDLLMQYGFFEVGRMPVIGAPSQAGSIIANDEGKEWYATTVSCPFQFYRTGTLTPLGQAIVNGISLQLGAVPAAAQASQGYPYDPSGHPYQVDTTHPSRFTQASDVGGHTPDPGNVPKGPKTVPHPLNPAQQVTVRGVYPFQNPVRPPSINGRAIPITEASVEQSPSSLEVTSTVKV
jgi:hypothetical protein